MSRDYREKVVDGFIADVRDTIPNMCNVTIRMTSDKRGQTVSLQAANIIVGIPLEQVTDIIKVVKKNDKR